MLTQEELKKSAAEAALSLVPENTVIGVGTGSTVNYFIEGLALIRHSILGAVASSEETAARLKKLSIPVFELNAASEISIYVDGADEVNPQFQMIKGGGGALTREKIIAYSSPLVVCIVDDSKMVPALGQFPIAIEVIPMARSFVAREIVKLGGDPVYREGMITDNGNIILDVYNLPINEPIRLEESLNQLVGSVMNGLFAKRPADIILAGKQSGVVQIRRA